MKDVPDMEIPTELCLELLIAADYLHGEWSLFQIRVGRGMVLELSIAGFLEGWGGGERGNRERLVLTVCTFGGLV